MQASAKLSIIVGEIMFTLNQFRSANEWYKTAEHAAHDVGDGVLADIVLANQANLPTYSDDPRGVLALLAQRLERNTSSSPALAWLWGFKARAHAALQEPGQFWRSIDKAHEFLARSPADLVSGGILSCPPERLAFYEATGATRLHDSRAVSAADRALSLYDPSETTEPALVKLDRASALADAGEVPEACRVAVEALLDRRTYHSVSVRTYAGKFDERVRGVQLPETREWREIHSEVHGKNRAVSKGPEKDS